MFYPLPARIEARVFARMPEALRRPVATEWAAFNRPGQLVDCFLEGPSFDARGDLFVTDIPHGRILRVSPDGRWSEVAQLDGWPNGLKFHRDGRAFITDYKRGLRVLDVASGRLTPVAETFRSESFKGVNDLVFAASGDLYFTDQGQTGLQDPTGRVFRLGTDGRLTLLIDTIPSPNGIVLDHHERAIYVSVTRANAIWRLPLMPDGMVSKCGLFIQLSGGHSGPDGLALDEEGGLVVAHIGIGVWRFDRLGRPTHLIEPPASAGRTCTNVAFGGPARRQLFITESESGSILVADLPVAGKALFGPKPA